MDFEVWDIMRRIDSAYRYAVRMSELGRLGEYQDAYGEG